jgi:hypothetical protein
MWATGRPLIGSAAAIPEAGPHSFFMAVPAEAVDRALDASSIPTGSGSFYSISVPADVVARWPVIRIRT